MVWGPADKEDECGLVVPAVLDITIADPLLRALIDRSRTGDPIILCCSEISRVSTAAIQVLIAMAIDAHTRGLVFQLRDPSPAFSLALADLGVSSHLSL